MENRIYRLKFFSKTQNEKIDISIHNILICGLTFFQHFLHDEKLLICRQARSDDLIHNI